MSSSKEGASSTSATPAAPAAAAATGGHDHGGPGVAAAAAVAAQTTVAFTTLPTGPLATVVLYLTESDLAQLLRTHRHVRTSELDSQEFWRDRATSTFGQHLSFVQSLGKDDFQTFLAAKRHLAYGSRHVDRLAPGLSSWEKQLQWFESSDQLLDKCVGASSQDREDEFPGHTLEPSLCALMLDAGIKEGKLSQSECGCVLFDKCYWSSEPSPVAEKDEWLEYDLADGLAMVSSFVLTPYTSFWQPEQPTYNPEEAFFQLFHPRINGGKRPYYESPRYRVEGSMKRQQFDLPQPILSLGGRAKIVLVRMAQRQTLHPMMGETANHYHICISYAALVGNVLRGSVSNGAGDGQQQSESTSVDALAGGKTTGAQESAGGSEGRSCRHAQAGCPVDGWMGENEIPRVRLRWEVEVFIYRGGFAKNERPDSEHNDHLLAYSDYPCREFVEGYRRNKAVTPFVGGKGKIRRPGGEEDAGLLLAGDPRTRVLPTHNGAVLGDFAVQGRLELVDPLSNSGILRTRQYRENSNVQCCH